jgi:hypothetical protein
MSSKTWITLCAAALGLCACAAETAGREVDMRWVFAQDESAANPEFDTATGWHVTLSEARLALESIYVYGADPETRLARRLERWLVPVARAHGGHDPITGRPIRAELLDPPVLDLLDTETHRLPLQAAEAGAVETIKFLIASPKAKLPDELHGGQAYVRGSAERAGEKIEFSGTLEIRDESEPARRVERTKLSADLDEATTISVAVRPSVWFQEAEFDRLESADGDDPVTISPSNQVGRAWAVALRSPDAFSIEFGKD